MPRKKKGKRYLVSYKTKTDEKSQNFKLWHNSGVNEDKLEDFLSSRMNITVNEIYSSVRGYYPDKEFKKTVDIVFSIRWNVGGEWFRSLDKIYLHDVFKEYANILSMQESFRDIYMNNTLEIVGFQVLT